MVALLVLVWLVRAEASPPEADPKLDAPAEANPSPPEPTPPDPALIVDRLNQRAAAIEALLEGRLDPVVALSDVFVLVLDDPALAGPDGWSGLLTAIQKARSMPEPAPAPEPAPLDKRRPSRSPPEPEPAPQIDPVDYALPLAPTDADPLTRARNRVERAYLRFALLDPTERQALVDAHEARRSENQRRQQSEAKARARLELLQREADQLAALIDGTLDPAVDPTPLLEVDLGAADELLRNPERLARALGLATSPAKEPAPSEATAEPPTGEGAEPTSAPEPAPSEEPSSELALAITVAEQALDRQRLRYLALTPEQRLGLISAHRERKRAADEAALVDPLLEVEQVKAAEVEDQISEAEQQAAQANFDREQALVAAAKAHSEAIRRLANERARLLGVKEQHALFRAELKRRNKQILASHETALGWDRRVAELTQLSLTREDEAMREADGMFEELRAGLGDARDLLRATLDEIGAGDSQVEPVGDPLPGVADDVDAGDLRDLRTELLSSETELRQLELESWWEAADSERDDIVMLNNARLQLLELGSSELRKRVTGFGRDGVQQVQREIDQIVLELRYRALSLPQLGRRMLREIETSPLPLIGALLELIVLIVVFRMWRQRADGWVGALRRQLLRREPAPRRIERFGAALLWYLSRIRQPLEWLGLFALLFNFVLPGEGMLELQVLWLILLWLLLGSTVILFVDAVAAREGLLYGRGTRESAALRIRSLRVVGLTIVLTGLVLSLTEEIVGRGAIHRWVRSLIWIAAIPITLWLIHRWRKHVFARLRDDPDLPDNALVRWLRAHQSGWASFIAATVAGVYLFARGLLRWLLHRATNLEITRRLLAWLFRREVARQANARKDDGKIQRPLDPDRYARFDPGGRCEQPLPDIARDELDSLLEFNSSQGGTLSAVIGEYGAGRTHFLRQLASELELRARAREATPDKAQAARLKVSLIQCPPGGFEVLLGAIAEAIGLERMATRAQVVETLSDQPRVVLLDDIHRLVRPAIGGLRGLDQFAEFVREVSDPVSWICSIGSAAWQYVSRARGERVFFDRVVELPAWTEPQITALIRGRSHDAGVHPNFDDIVIPRQFDAATLAEGEARASESERSELGYYRILWDYSLGNPAIALHFWRESLVVTSGEDHDGDGDLDRSRATVRLFKEPPAAELDEVGAMLHFVLRAIVQLEVASQTDLVDCTQLPAPEVADALRHALRRGWIEHIDQDSERYRVTWRWFRAITNMLRRQHLLVLSRAN